MSGYEPLPRVLIAGGGIAALKLVLAGSHVATTLLTAEPLLAPRAMTVAEPFDRGGAQTWDWAQITADQHAGLVVDRLVAVDAAERIAFTHGGRRLPYDVLVLATGARRVEPFAGALTFGMSDRATADVRAMVAGVCARGVGDIVFALPSPSIWPLPLYELALQTADELREHGCPATVRIVTPSSIRWRPSRLAAQPMVERVPADADHAGGGGDAVMLALALARMEARAGNRTRALQAIEAARALDASACGPAGDQLVAQLTQVPSP